MNILKVKIYDCDHPKYYFWIFGNIKPQGIVDMNEDVYLKRPYANVPDYAKHYLTKTQMNKLKFNDDTLIWMESV
jgi:hypothetical protein